MRRMLVLALCSSSAVALATPLSLQHSGYLLTAADVPVDGATNMAFAIYDGSGTTIWTSSTCNVAVAAGYYSVVLGGACNGAVSLDTSHVPPGQTRMLEVSVGGITLAPRLLLSASPTAAQAVTSQDTQALATLLSTGGAINVGGNPVDWTKLKNVPANVVGAAQASNNLSDLTNVATARTNLGLGTSATLNVAASGNASATQIVKGDDSRLAGNLAAANNLSDLTNAATARTNLGLGTAAPLSVAASGNASTTQVVKGDDTRLTDARAPSGGSANYIQNGSSAQTAAFNITGNGAVGGTFTATGMGSFGAVNSNGVITSNGQIRTIASGGTTAKLNGTTTIDWNVGNLQILTLGCQALTFQNMLDGGAYTLVVTGAAAGTCTFSQTTPDTLTNGAFRFQPANGTTAANTHTVYTFLRANGTVYVSWIGGF